MRFDRLVADMERANRHPDRTVRGVLRAGKQPGTADMTLKVAERFPQHIRASLDNQGTRLIGRNRYGIGYSNSNLLGREDEFNGKVILGRRLRAVGVDYQVPLNRLLTSLDVGFSHTEAKPTKEFEDLGVAGLSSSYSISLLQPFYLPRRWLLEIETGYDHRSVITKLGGNELTRDELRVWKTGTSLRVRTKHGTTVWTNDLRLGIPHLFGGAAVKQERFSRTSAGGRFAKWGVGLLRIQKLPLQSTAVFNFQAQVTAHKLPTSERFFLGGATTVRGYPEGEYLGENAILMSTELLVPAFLIPDRLKAPFSEHLLKEDLQMIGFADMGKGWLKETIPGVEDGRDLFGLGAGFRIRLFNRTFARFEWGVPLGDKSSDKRHYAFHFTISAEAF